MPITSRNRLWIEVPAQDLADVQYVSEYLTSTNVALTQSTTDTFLASDALGTVEIAALPTDMVLASDLVAGAVSAPLLADTLWVNESLPFAGTITAANLTETGIATEILDAFACAVTVDQLSVLSSLTGQLALTGTSADIVVVHDGLTAHFNNVTSDGLVATETLTTDYSPRPLDNSVSFSDALHSRSSLTATTADIIFANDALGYGWLADTSETGILSDRLEGSVILASPLLTDTGVSSDLVSGTLAIYAALPSDTGIAGEALESRLMLVGVLVDTALAEDVVRDATYQAVVITNLDTGAVSTYTLTPTMAGLAEYRGTLYLAGPDGLYALDAVTDSTAAISWTLHTGFSVLGTDKLKRLQDINVLARTTGTVTLQVVTDRAGIKQTWDYQLPMLTRTAYRDGVIKVGKGVQSVYYGFSLSGSGATEIDQLRMTVEPLSRRR